VIVGGNFTHAGTSFAPGAPVDSNSIAAWDGSGWQQIGKGLGFGGGASRLLRWNGGLVAVGAFQEAGRSIAHYVAFFDGVDWRHLGMLDGPAYDAIVVQNELVVAGTFTSVDGVSAIGAAAFDGTSWHGFGAAGVGNGYGAQTIAVYQNQLYAGSIGGAWRFNGTSWETFAPQIFGNVGDLHVHNGVLYIAGFFTLMGGHVASWDGATQQIVGGGMNDQVTTLESFGGELLAGGLFTQAGGQQANRLARWNGSSWSAFPGITGQEVNDLTVFRGSLVASGNTLLANPPRYLARWDGAAWQSLGGGGPSGPSYTLLPDDVAGRLWAGGLFQDADGKPSWGIARWDEVGAGTPFCFGDGSGTACPCGNESPAGSGAGCLNSAGAGGALGASGGASLSSDALLLSGSGMPSSSALYFQGTTRTAGGAGAVFGDGLRCASGSIVRLGTELNVGGASQYPAPGQLPVSMQGQIAQPGTRTYQVWYRNAAPFCTSSTFNLTNGFQVAARATPTAPDPVSPTRPRAGGSFRSGSGHGRCGRRDPSRRRRHIPAARCGRRKRHRVSDAR
jgi:hypothetical protein